MDKNTGLVPDGMDPIYSPGNPAFTQIAIYGGNTDDPSGGPIEAAYIYNRQESPYYYLFVNWALRIFFIRLIISSLSISFNSLIR